MVKLWALPLLVPAGAVYAAPTPPTPVLAWVFDTHPDKELVPRGKVFLKVGSKRIVIEPKAQAEFRTLSRADYKEYKVPASALTACSGWFAGGGEDMYVVAYKKSLRVYRRWTDEQAPEFHYTLIRTIAL